MKTTTLGAALFAGAAAALALGQAPADPDMWWHLASGDWMLDHGAILDRDIFSYTRAGTSYSSGQWLGQIVLALAIRGGGWFGLDLLRALLVGCGAFFLARAVMRVQPHIGWAAVPITGALLVSKITWGDRPQLFTIALFPVVLEVLLSARLGARGRAIYGLPVLFLLWSNLHGAFAAGLALLALFFAEAIVARTALRRPLAVALVLSLLATQLNPGGGGALGFAAAYASAPGRFIVEERPPDFLSAPGLVFAALILAALASALALGRDGLAARVGPPLLWPALVIPFTVLGLSIQRQMPLACAVLAPLVAASVPAAIGRPSVAPLDVPRRFALPALAALALALAATAATMAPVAPDLAAYPADAIVQLRAIRGNLLNEYDWGGYLIRESPEHPTFIDGRGALLFVPDVLRDFKTATELGPGYRAVLARYDVRAVLLRPDRPLVGALREDGWAVRGEEPRWVLLERP